MVPARPATIAATLLAAATAAVLLSGCYGAARMRSVGNPSSGLDRHATVPEQAPRSTRSEPLSAFAIDVDTASYAIVRRHLEQGTLPPPEAVRIEELVNYFPTTARPPTDGAPFRLDAEVAACPWSRDDLLASVTLQAREVPEDRLPPCNLVFLVDVSGSMAGDDRLPLVKRALRLLADRLRDEDSIAIVTYAGSVGVALPPTRGSARGDAIEAIEELSAGGSTAGGSGIRTAYRTARSAFIGDGENRVVLCTDGDFNVGVTDAAELQSLIAEEARSGIHLTVLGFGMGNLRDDRLELLADRGNGAYAYIDSLDEARKALVEQRSGTLLTVAEDVKVQVEFNPATVAAYRLIGYENRAMTSREFADERTDAGELGAGHTVTALYQLTPARRDRQALAEGRRYAPVAEGPAPDAGSTRDGTGHQEWFAVSARWKDPRTLAPGAMVLPVPRASVPLERASDDLRFAAAVAAFGMRLRRSDHAGAIGWSAVQDLAAGALGSDPGGHRAAFLGLVRRAAELDRHGRDGDRWARR